MRSRETGRPGPVGTLITAVAAFNVLGAGGGAIALAGGWLDFGDTVTGRLPWESPVFAAAALAVIVALPNAVLTILTLRRDPRSGALSILAGALLVGWILVELAFIRELSFLQPLYLAVGLVQMGLGVQVDSQPLRGIRRTP